jgi:UDP-N-acetyl-D-glucosamine dehydrogenase
MGIDIWDVIAAARTKPFGFMAFHPGPGIGGHCIPVDPLYLAWKARQHGVATRLVELAGEINDAMPGLVLDRLEAAMRARHGRGLAGALVLVLGVAYKKNVDDPRESPALRLIELIERRGGRASYHDPLIPAIPAVHGHEALAGRRSVPLDPAGIAAHDAAVIVADHDGVDYAALARHAKLLVDTRDICARAGLAGDNIVKA